MYKIQVIPKHNVWSEDAFTFLTLGYCFRLHCFLINLKHFFVIMYYRLTLETLHVVDIAMNFIDLTVVKTSSTPHVVNIACPDKVLLLLQPGANIKKLIVSLMRSSLCILVVSAAIYVPELVRFILEIFGVYDIPIVCVAFNSSKLLNEPLVATKVWKATINTHPSPTGYNESI